MARVNLIPHTHSFGNEARETGVSCERELVMGEASRSDELIALTSALPRRSSTAAGMRLNRSFSVLLCSTDVQQA